MIFRIILKRIVKSIEKNNQCCLVKRRRSSPQFNLLVLTNDIDDFFLNTLNKTKALKINKLNKTV